jgi:hypothetical protein
LPTFKEKDAIYTYHFYHLLQRAKNIYLLYNTESEGIDAGEKSRLLHNWKSKNKPIMFITHEIYNAILPEIAHQPMVIPKSEFVMLRLREIAEKGFSPSALTSYIRNPIDFYFQKIFHIREVEEVEENIALIPRNNYSRNFEGFYMNRFVGKFFQVEKVTFKLFFKNSWTMKC